MLLLAVLGACAGPPASAVAAAVSANWSGYSVAKPTGNPSFSSVAGTWTTPAVTCTPGSTAYSAAWIGIGGAAQSSTALEQAGTEADCDSSGHPQYAAWYELLPAPPVAVKLPVSPGDAVSGYVAVVGKSPRLHVLFILIDRTRGNAKFQAELKVSKPDLSSAEWIVEAPSECNGASCRALPLANFGTVPFGGAHATSVGHTGPISDSAWSATAITLQSGSVRPFGFGRFRRFGPSPNAFEALPSGLSASGDSFSVAWSLVSPPAPTTSVPMPSAALPTGP